MTVIFLIHRISAYRHMVPLIREGLERGYNVECWHDYSIGKGGERWYSFPDIEAAPRFDTPRQPVFKSYYGVPGLETELSKRLDIDFVVSLHPSTYDSTQKFLESAKFRWVFLMHSPDTFFVLNKKPRPEAMKYPKEIFAVFSKQWVEWGKEYFGRFFPHFSYLLDNEHADYITVGNPEFDIFKRIDPDAVRAKYSIPKGKQVLLYLPFPFYNRSLASALEMAFCGWFTNTKMANDGKLLHDSKKGLKDYLAHKALGILRIMRDPVARGYWLKGINEERVFTEVRKFCKINDLFLVVKPRLKFPIAESVKKGADLIVFDTEREQNPPALKELLTISKMTISYFSFAAFTSVYAKVFHLNLIIPEECFVDNSHKFWFQSEAPSIFNFPGVCTSWSIERAIRSLADTKLDYFKVDEKQHAEYEERYLTYSDSKCSARLFDQLEKGYFNKRDEKQDSFGSLRTS